MKSARRIVVVFLALVAFAGIVACEVSAPGSNNAVATPANTKATVEPATETPLTDEQVWTARGIVQRAEFEAYAKLGEAAKKRNSEIRAILQKRRLDTLTQGLPAWVKDHLVAFEESASDYGFAFSRSIAWGTGRYKGQAFYWFGHTNSDGWLQMDLSVALDQKDIDKVYGRKPDDVEGALGNPDRKIDVDLGSNDTPGTKTHIGTNGGVDWMNEFCVHPETATCDTAGAFEKELIPAANSALLGLSFTLGGRFP